MITKLKYGDYVFDHNPQQSTSSFQGVGDKIVTLSGRRIYQPTGFIKKQRFSAVFYQPRTYVKDIRRYSGTKKIDFDNNEKQIYLCSSDSNIIEVYNYNFKYIRSISLTKLADENIVELTSLGNYLWVCITDGTSERLAQIDKTNSIQIDYSLNITTGINGLANDGVNIYAVTGMGELIEINPNDVSQTIISNLTNRYYSGLTFDGKYFWSGDYAWNDSTAYQFDRNGQTINSLLDFIVKQQDSSFYNINSLAYDQEKKVMFISLGDSYNTKLISCVPNTVIADVFTLENEIKKGKVYMTDQNSRKHIVTVNNFNYKLSENSLAVNIDIDVDINI